VEGAEGRGEGGGEGGEERCMGGVWEIARWGGERGNRERGGGLVGEGGGRWN